MPRANHEVYRGIELRFLLLLAGATTAQTDHCIITPEGVVIRSPHLDNVSRNLAEVMNVSWVVPQLVVENLVVRRIHYPEWLTRTRATR